MAYANIGKGHPVGTYTNEAGVALTVHESVTGIQASISGNLLKISYVSEEEALGGLPAAADQQFNIDLSSILPGGAFVSAVNIDAAGNIVFTKGDGSTVSIKADNLTVLGPVSGTSLGYTDELGTTNFVNLQTLVQAAETDTTLTNAQASGKIIGTYTNEAGVAVDIKESVTSFSVANGATAGTLDFTFTDENGAPVTTNIDVCAVISSCSTTPFVFAMGYHPTDFAAACADAP